MTIESLWNLPSIVLFVTVQYLHSYRQKSMQDRLWRWDFCLDVVHFLTVSAVNVQTY